MAIKKNVYSIKDLENLSGIKAHTIRIWEKRYNILEPMRTDSNIRFYDLHNLKKLLNITLLHNHGYKISKISQYDEAKIPNLVKGIITDKNAKSHALSTFKIAIINFDQALFLQTYDRLLSEKSFREIFYDVLIPLLNEIGMLWQTDTITPAHEHFACNLIRQKIMVNTEKHQIISPENDNRTFVLFLPENESHETALLYLNFELAFYGYHTVYLGANVPLANLKKITDSFENIVFVGYFSLEPDKDEIQAYVQNLQDSILDGTDSECWILGNQIKHLNSERLSSQIHLVHALKDFTKKL